jgi:lysophospholipase L1-like esterase/LysM repeat protein
LRVKLSRAGAALACSVLVGSAGLPSSVRADETHVIEAGETLWEIAREHDVSIDALRDANGLGESDRILAGGRLRIPAAGATATPAAARSPATNETGTVAAPPPATNETAAAEPEAPASGEPADAAAAGDEAADELLARTEIEHPEVLASFFDAVSQAEQEQPGAVVRVAHFGDSHSATTAFTQAIRRTLAERVGDAGTGFLQPGTPWPSYDPPGVEIGVTGAWTFDRVRRTADGNLTDGLYGLGAFSARTAEPDATVWLRTEDDATAAGFEVEYLTQPDGGSAELLLDGEVVARIDSSGLGVGAAEHRVQTEDGGHRFEIRARGDGEVRLLGLEAERAGPGVRYDVLAANGARADWLLSWNADLFVDRLARRDPDLVVLMYGTNEAGDPDLDLERYAADFARALELVRGGAPGAACLVLAPPDMSERRRRRFVGTPEVLPRVIELQRTAAAERDCAFFDTFGAMGGAGSMDRWAAREPPLAGRDRVHLTARGYRALGEAIGAALLRAYDGRRTGGTEPP